MSRKRWTCPDCLATSLDVIAALEHEETLGHGVPVLDLRPAPKKPVPAPIEGQLEIALDA